MSWPCERIPGTGKFPPPFCLGVAQNLIDKSGAWYSYNGDRIGQGKENVRQFLRDNPAIANEIDKQLRERLLVPVGKAAAAGPEEALEEA